MKYEFLKELQEPSVIWEEDPNEPDNPEVLVQGVGRYKLKSLERNVQSKLKDLAEKGSIAKSHDHWKNVAWMLDHAAMNQMIKTIMAAKKELEGNNDEAE